jgi:alpha-ribazole phosphatase
MPPCGPTADRSMAKPTSPAIAATTLSSRALPECCRTVLSGSAPHLSRAHHTAEALWRSGYFNENEAAPPLRSVPEFAEQHLGEWRGLDRAQFAAGRPAMAASYWYAPADERPAGGESFAEVCARVRVAVDRLTDAFRGRDIVAVAHGGSIRAALAIALSLDPQAVLAFAVENCSLTRLDYFEGQSGSGWRIGTVNQQPWRDKEPGWRSGETSPRHPARLRVGGSFQTAFSQEATQPSVNAAGER